MSKVTNIESRYELWRRANLSWKLDSTQKELYKLFYESNFKVQTWLLSRRSGKSWTLCVLALEQCIREPHSIVKFVSPTKLQVQNNVRPLFRKILADCPPDLKPEFKYKDYIYYFPNGSEIHLAGSDSGHAEKLRGSDSSLAFIDEAGSCDNLDDLVKSILLPTTLITGGKIVLASTPPKESDHDFLKFIEDAAIKGSLIKKTIYDNPRLTEEQRQELIDEVGGINTDVAKRELLCVIIKDANTSVLPEYTEELEKEIVKEWPKPPFFDSYEAMDLGFKDLTVVLFGYYDFRSDKVIIEDEIVIDFKEQNTTLARLTAMIKEKENTLWMNYLTNELRKPCLRVSDINYIVMNEIRQYSGGEINFIAAKKDDNEAAINNLRIMLSNKKIIINPRCKILRQHLLNVRWASANNKSVFARSPDSGHYDAVDALKYMIRHISYTKNPYPANYDMNLRKQDAFFYNNVSNNSTHETFKQIFNLKRKNYGR